MPVVSSREDYWRIYQQGIVTIAENYREDHIIFRLGSKLPFLLVSESLAKMHALLAHERLMAQELPAVNQIVLRMDWRGLRNRDLCWDPDTVVSGGEKLADHRFVRSFTLSWSDLRNSYFPALRRAALPLFSMFDFPSFPDAATWLTQNVAQDQLKHIDHGMSRFDPYRLLHNTKLSCSSSFYLELLLSNVWPRRPFLRCQRDQDRLRHSARAAGPEFCGQLERGADRSVAEELSRFTGSDHWFRHGLVRSIVFTDGAKYIACNKDNCARPGSTLNGRNETDDLARRAWEHRAGLLEGFTKQYRLARLVLAEY